MCRKDLAVLLAAVVLVALVPLGLAGAETTGDQTGSDTEKTAISVPEGMDKVVAMEMTQVSKHFKKGARRLFERTPLGFDLDTVDSLGQWLLDIPLKVSGWVEHIREQGRLLGVVGSLVVLAFLGIALYSLIGQKRVLTFVEHRVNPLRIKIPEAYYRYFLSLLKVVVASLIPLLLLGVFWLMNQLMEYDAPWFVLTGRLLGLWAVGALILNILHESLTQGLFHVASRYGTSVYRISRIVLFYIVGCVAIFWAATAFKVPEDVLSLLRFLISLSVVFVLFLLLLKKRALLSLLPDLPYRHYRALVKGLGQFWFPAIFLTFVSGLLWCAGYHRFCKVLWVKTWAVAGTLIALMIFYHVLQGWLKRWAQKKGGTNEEAQFLYRSMRSLVLYAMVIAAVVVTLDLLGLLTPFARLMSFPVVKVGDTPLSLWTLIKAVLILLGFVYVSRLLRAYLDYKIYPLIGVDPGLAYAINTFLSYFMFIVGFAFSLRAMGLDLRMLMVFAGAVGIGIGFGLQREAANVISGFTLLFGRMFRKGDMIRVGGTQGLVQDIGLRTTKLRSGDNIEYLIPNAEFVASTVTNYTLSSSLIRIRVPVGVSYDSDPEQVRSILLKVAHAHPEVVQRDESKVWLDAYGDNAINFTLLVWIDARKSVEGEVRSALYFEIFKALKTAGIGIPFPQRDIHIRSAPAWFEGTKR